MAWTMLCCICLATIITMGQTHDQPERYVRYKKVKYFTDVSMICDHNDLNVSSSRNSVQFLKWIFPDGTLVDANTHLDHKLYQLSGINDTTAPSGQRLMGYNLTLFEVDDDVFGYYTCLVMMMQNSGETPGSSGNVYAIRWGMNVHGADFSDLLKTYKENAIIGGIAAGTVLVLIVGGFLIWYRFCNDNKYIDDQIKSSELTGNGIEMQENIGYVTDPDEKTSSREQHAEPPDSEMDTVKF